MWIERAFEPVKAVKKAQSVRILKGPRQVGKTSLLEKIPGLKTIYFDDLSARRAASENPRLFLDQFSGALLLDEATLVPELFFELKRRVDEAKRLGKLRNLDIWVTGSNQTLLKNHVKESLAGRASYFDLNTLAIFELGTFSIAEHLMKGGWPELRTRPEIDSVRFLDDLLATFVGRDIVLAAGIEKKSAFTKALALLSARIGQLFQANDIARNVGVSLSTVQSWFLLLEENGILFRLPAFSSNLNQRLTKAPKYYFHDVALVTRLQGWAEFKPLMLSPSFGPLLENIAVSEIYKVFFLYANTWKIVLIEIQREGGD